MDLSTDIDKKSTEDPPLSTIADSIFLFLFDVGKILCGKHKKKLIIVKNGDMKSNEILSLAESAKTYQMFEKYSRAENCLEQILEIDETNEYALYNLAVINKIIKEYEKSVLYFRKLIKSNCKNKKYLSEAHFEYAMYCKEMKKYNLSIKNFLKSIKYDSKCAKVYYELGRVHKIQKEYDKALSFFTIAMRMNEEKYKEKCKDEEESINEEVEEAYQSCEKLFEEKKYKDSLQQLEKLENSLTPEIFKGFYIMGCIYFEIGEYQKAITYFNKHIETPCVKDCCYNKLGRVYTITEKYDDAEKCYKKAIEIDPKKFNSYFDLAVLYEKQKRFKEILFCFESVVGALGGVNIKLRASKFAGLFEQNGMFVEAMQIYKRILEFDNGNLDALYYLGVIYMKFVKDTKCFDDHYKAIECFEKYLSSERGNKCSKCLSNAYFEVGCHYKNRRMYTKALTYFKQSIVYNNGNCDSLFQIGWLYKIQMKYDLSKRYLEKAKSIDVNRKVFINEYDEVIRKLNKKIELDSKEELKYFYNAIKVYPKNVNLYISIGDIFVEMDNYNNAYEYYKMFINSSNVHDVKSVHMKLGHLYFNKKKFKDSIKHFEVVLEKEKSNSKTMFEVMFYIAVSYKEIGDVKKSIELFRKCVICDCGSKDEKLLSKSFCEIGIFNKNEKYFDQAVYNFEEAIKINPENFEAYYQIGCVYSILMYYNKSLLFLRKAMKHDGDCKVKKQIVKDKIEDVKKMMIYNSSKDETTHLFNVKYMNTEQFKIVCDVTKDKFDKFEKELYGKMNDLWKEMNCCVCLSEKKCCLFIPCNHISVCMKCSKKIKTCPICRTKIKSKIKAYL